MKIPRQQVIFFFFTIWSVLILWTVSPCTKALSETLPLAEYEAHYQISWHGIKAGESVHKLYRLRNGDYRLEVSTKPYIPVIPVRQFESSDFIWQDGKVIPNHYSYDIRESRRHKKGLVSFNRKNKTVSNTQSNEPWSLPMPQDIQDKLTHALMLRHDLKKDHAHTKQLTYTVAEDDEIKDYTFTVIGSETISTKMGHLDTLKLEHISRKGHRTTLWLSKKFDYLPVFFNQARKGKVVGEGKILSLGRPSS